MQCSQCQHENRDTARFCEKCGSSLGLSCPSCGIQNRPGAAFCDTCGSGLSKETPVPIATQLDTQRSQREIRALHDELPSTEYVAPEAERRQLTVMFCDLVE